MKQHLTKFHVSGPNLKEAILDLIEKGVKLNVKQLYKQLNQEK